jgi:uncharacterized protein (TIGR00730 family)
MNQESASQQPGSVPPAANFPPPVRKNKHATVEELIAQLKETGDKFLRDKASRADVKMVVTAVRELRYALKIFAQYRHVRKIVIFGSARTPREHASYNQCVEFAGRMAEAGYIVITGASTGIMEAGHVGAGLDRSLGVNILLPFEQAANYIIAGDLSKLVHLKYFFTRKLMLVKEAQAVAVFPGGFGTHDETFEVLTLMQTGKAPIVPVVFLEEPGGDYWKHWLAFVKETLLSRGYICPEDLALFTITDDVNVAVRTMLRFYNVYHSMRYVGNRLVVRLNQQLGPAALAELNDDFVDLLASGAFEQTGALQAEAGDEHIAHLPRLTFHFNKKKLGRLRQMIDFLNDQ